MNIPVSAKYNLSEKFSLLAGPQFGILMSAKEDFDVSETISGVNDTYSESADVKDFYKSLVLKNCQIGRIMLQNLSSMTLQAVSREAQHASIGAVVATVGPEKNCEFTYFEQDLVVK